MSKILNFKDFRKKEVSLGTGFTIIEVLVVITIMLILSLISVSSLLDMNKNQALERDVDMTRSLLNEAKALSISSLGASQYGVHFEESKAVLFKGNVYDPTDLDNKILFFNRLVKMSSKSLNGGANNVLFSRVDGNTNQYGTITLSYKSGTGSKVITIFYTGVVETN